MNPKAKSLTHQPKTCALAFLDLVPGNYYWPESKTKRERADPETYSEITGRNIDAPAVIPEERPSKIE